MRSSLPYVLLIVLVAAGALALRLPRLDERPMHTDEAVHTVKFDDLRRTGLWEYDVHDYHGPTMYYATLAPVWLSGAKSFPDTDEWMYRIVPVVFGVGLVLLLAGTRRGLGWVGGAVAGVLTAVCPAMVYFSRYYIMEVLLVFFTFAVILAGWRYARTGKVLWAAAAGAGAGLMHATKETCVIAFGAMGLALVVSLGCERLLYKRTIPVRWGKLCRDACVGLAVAAAVSVMLFSVFFQDWDNVPKSIATFSQYLQRSGGDGRHEHPWYYYLRMLLWAEEGGQTEGFIVLLGTAGAVLAFVRKDLPGLDLPLARFLAVYTLAMTAAYSAIPYKTPWCLLGFLHGFLLLAGFAAAWVVRAVPRWWATGLVRAVVAVGAVHLGWQAYRGSFVDCDDNLRNPYVYAHTARDVYRLVVHVERIALGNPKGYHTLVKVITVGGDCWPLPWYFRRFVNVGYYPKVPADPRAGVIIVSPALGLELGKRLRKVQGDDDYVLPGGYTLRRGVTLWLLVDMRLTAQAPPYSPRPHDRLQYLHELVSLVREISRIAPEHLTKETMAVNIIGPAYGCRSLPWYLPDVPNVRYFPKTPDSPDAPVVVVAEENEAEFARKADRAYQSPDAYEIRPGVTVRLFVKPALWDVIDYQRRLRDSELLRKAESR